ncbi:MAG: hypothetical protein ABJL99_00975 [Aliishimia sp.]
MTTFKALTLAATFTLLPGLALAMGCNYGDHSKQAQSCIAGSSWDSATSSCVPQTSS